MSVISDDGNGGKALALNAKTLIPLGLVITLLATAAYFGGMRQTFADHCGDANIHWTKATLDHSYVPRPEYAATLEAIKDDLREIKADLKDLKKVR